MKCVKYKKAILFCLILFSFNQNYAQLFHSQNIKLSILEIKDTLLTALLDSVLNFEAVNCYSSSDEKSYFMACKIIDSITMYKELYINSISTNNTLEIASVFGIFYIGKHTFYIDESMDSFFVKLNKKVRIKKVTLDYSYAEKHKITLLKTFSDDSQTKWTFLFKNGKYILIWMDGQCKNMPKIDYSLIPETGSSLLESHGYGKIFWDYRHYGIYGKAFHHPQPFVFLQNNTCLSDTLKTSIRK